MKYLEIIELRSIKHDKRELELQLKNLINKIKQEFPQIKIKLYSHISIDTDFSIHIFSDLNEYIKDPGVLIKSSLNEFGITNVSIWIERDKNK